MSALITTETFHEIPVRIVQGENCPVIPLVDIAHGLGYDPRVINRLYERNLELLGKYSQGTIMTTGDQVSPVTHVCLSRDGIVGLTMKLDYRRTKDPSKKSSILAFQDWAIETLGKVMDGKVHPTQPMLPPLSDALKEEMARADAMRIVGVDVGLASSVCLAKLEDEYNTDLSYLRNLLTRKDDRDIAYLTATAIGKKFKLSPQSINNVLEKSGYQKHSIRVKKTGDQKKIWNLTDKGHLFGEVHFERHGGTQTYLILWRDSIIREIENILDNESRSKQGLLIGELGA